jgi:hypothetical protein
MKGGARDGSGRKRNRAFLMSRLKEMYGEDFDPILSMCEIATNDENDDTLKLSAFKEVAQYLYPKLKSVEVTGDNENPLVNLVKIELVRPEDFR